MALQASKALCNPWRVRILEALSEGSASPAQLAERFGADLDRISYHFKVLKATGAIQPVKAEPERTAVEPAYKPRPSRN